jgi:hypothetical protein
LGSTNATPLIFIKLRITFFELTSAARLSSARRARWLRMLTDRTPGTPDSAATFIVDKLGSKLLDVVDVDEPPGALDNDGFPNPMIRVSHVTQFIFSRRAASSHSCHSLKQSCPFNAMLVIPVKILPVGKRFIGAMPRSPRYKANVSI